MIDEKKLIESLRASLNTGRESFPVDLIVECIEEQPKIGEWIPCSECLPEDVDNRFFMCIVENHEEDLPMFCQYEEEYGFGFWHDIFNEETLGFVDTEFKTNEELGYEKVIAWMPLPEPYILNTDTAKKTNADRIRSMTDDELGKFLRKVKADYQWSDPEFPDVDDDWTEWLQEEVEE